jgi:hypothetical protein
VGLTAEVKSWVDGGCLDLAKKIRDDIKSRTPVITGNLRDSITAERRDRESSIVYTCVKYSRPVEFGHRAFTVYPVHARCLHWDDVFAMHARIPATRGQHYFFGREGAFGSSEIKDIWDKISKL